MKKVIILNKNGWETPLQCLEFFRLKYKEYKNIPMTYAGRLDPMASGVLVILVGEECKKKEKYLKLDKEYEEIIKDELNVKEVFYGAEFKLDTDITPELKTEGNYRELVRALQDMRKDMGLTPDEVVGLKISENAKDLVEKFETDLKKTVGINTVVFADGEVGVTIGTEIYKVSIEK